MEIDLPPFGSERAKPKGKPLWEGFLHSETKKAFDQQNPTKANGLGHKLRGHGHEEDLVGQTLGGLHCGDVGIDPERELSARKWVFYRYTRSGWVKQAKEDLKDEFDFRVPCVSGRRKPR